MSEVNSTDLVATPEELTDADLEQVAGGTHVVASVQHPIANVQHATANVHHATASVNDIHLTKLTDQSSQKLHTA